MSDLSVIIVNFNTKDLVVDCLKSIFENPCSLKMQVSVVDNGSTDGSLEEIYKKFPDVQVIEAGSNLGFAKANNLAMTKMRSDFYLLLNSDTLIAPRALEVLVDVAKKRDFGVASCKLLNRDGSFQPNAGELPNFWPMLSWLSGLDDILHLRSYHEKALDYYKDGAEVGWVSGSAMLIRRDVLENVGFLDEKIFMYAEDVDFCFRARTRGFKIGWTDQAEIVHLGGGSSANPKLNQWRGEFAGLLYFYKKHFGLVYALFIKSIFYVFLLARVATFAFLGNFKFAKTYAQIFASI